MSKAAELLQMFESKNCTLVFDDEDSKEYLIISNGKVIKSGNEKDMIKILNKGKAKNLEGASSNVDSIQSMFKLAKKNGQVEIKYNK